MPNVLGRSRVHCIFGDVRGVIADAFEMAARLGYDALEVMVTADPVSQDASVLARLSEYHGIPVVAVHAPNLIVTQRVWGRDAWGKLHRSRDLAQALGVSETPVREAIFQRLSKREQEHDGADKGIGVLIKIARAADVRGKPLP